ncbi:hypothetical protein BDY21DRAFT_413777 [Lineolata rhizophorae]|uniref:C2H2-type domain-containing protein n=1 Tax=Lineolata rhizophorae TaxID=578093 RepID=A0A6A6P958_9PEZI|nr:hypothetical protein BDY21DRAFT_413777 [Lineolata rhizophorae]
MRIPPTLFLLFSSTKLLLLSNFIAIIRPVGIDRRPRNSRGRSRSPVAIDRYQPDRSRDDYYRGDDRRRRSPPPAQPHIDRYVPGHEQSSPAVTQNLLPNPMTLDFQVGFNWFAEWWRMEQQVKEERERQKNGGRRPDRVKGEREAREERGKEREQIQAAYDSYKEKLQMQMARTFVQQHKGEEWFKEKYDPGTSVAFRQKLSEYRRGIYAQWEMDVDNGVFDEFTLEGIYKSESNGAGGVIEKEEGETTAANEVLGVGDLLPSRGGDLRDEAVLQPTLLIKTIAPTVSRDKMEAFCKEHLGEGEGGFKWLSLSDPNPQKKCHRIGWVVLNPAIDQPMKDDRGDGRDEEAEDGEDIGMKSEPEASTQSTAVRALNEINGKTIHDEERGDFTCHVGVHEPPSAPRKKALWDLFSAPERVERDLSLAIRLVEKLDEELGEDYNGVAKVEQRVEELRSKGWLQPPTNVGSTAKKDDKDPEDLEEGEDANMEDEDEGLYDEEVDDEELLAKKKKLDLLVEYLRRVYSFCFFCVFESDSVHELTRKCPGGHLRRPRSSLTSSAKAAARASASGQPFPLKKQESNVEGEAGSPTEEKKFNRGGKSQQQLQRAFNWVKTYEDKLLQILEPDGVDIKKLGGRPTEEAIEEELSKFVKQEDEAKFRCKVPECTKLFKGHNFWRKHVEKRHTEWYEKVKQDVNLVNTYVLDPAHIAPSRSDANSNGHFPMNNHMPTGTPRGFNLANMPFGMPGGFGTGMATPAAIQAYFNPSNWPAGGNMNGDEERHATGPMRRNFRMAGAGPRVAGPYDRQGKDSRNMRWNSGRLTPPRSQGGRPGGGRFGDGGASTVGPREAVQGRSLKSYEDLDAVEGGGNGELDY